MSRSQSAEVQPLLQGQRNKSYTTTEDLNNGESAQDSHQQEQADISAQIETIKENLPFHAVAASFTSLLCSLFVVAVDGTLFITLLNDVGTTFSSSDLSFWVGTAYTLAMCVVAPVYSRLNDVFGRKNALVCAVTLFLLGTSLCAIAPSMFTLILARAVAGLGGGGIQTCFAVILGDLVPLRKRASYQALAQVSWSLGNATGGPLGGLLGDLLGWRLAIAAQIPVLCLSLLIITFFLKIPAFPKSKEQQDRENQESSKSILQILQTRLDLTGCALLAATCLVMMLGLSILSAGNLPLSNVKVWGNLATSAILFAVLTWFEAYIAKEPILPLSLLKTRMVGLTVAFYFLCSLATSTLFYFPVFFRSVLLQTASQTGVHFIASTVTTTVGAFVSGALLFRTNRYYWFIIFCSIIAIFSPAYLSTWSNINPPSTLGQNLALAPIGFGFAAISSIVVVCVLAVCERDSQAAVMGLLYFSRSLGNIVGVSYNGALIQASLSHHLTKHISGSNAKELIDKIRKNANIVGTLPEEIKIIAFRAYSKALQLMNTVATIETILCFCIVLFLQEVPLDKKKPSDKGSDSTNHTAEEQQDDDQSEAA